MKIKIHCDNCNKIETIERELDTKKKASKLGIPLPNTKNGLVTYSLAHQGHTLIVDIDHNGDVRGKQVIERIDQTIEDILTAIATKILDNIILNENLDAESYSFLIITENKMIHNLLLGVFQHLIFNIPPGVDSLLASNSDESLLEYDKLTVYVGMWSEKVYNFSSDQTVLIYDINTETSTDVLMYIQKDQEMKIVTDYALLFDQKYIETPKGKTTLQALLEELKNVQMLDISDPEKAAKSLFTILNSYL